MQRTPLVAVGLARGGNGLLRADVAMVVAEMKDNLIEAVLVRGGSVTADDVNGGWHGFGLW